MEKPAVIEIPFQEERIERNRRTGRPALIGLFSFLLFFAALISGCVTLKDPEASQVNREVAIGSVMPGGSFGQTFQSRRSGFNGIELSLGIDAGETPVSGELNAALYHAPWEEVPIAEAQVSLAGISHQSPVTIALPAQHDPPGQSYYLELKSDAIPVQVYGRQENMYSPGSAYLNRVPVDADASFQLSYRYGLAAFLDDITSWFCQALSRHPRIHRFSLPWLVDAFLQRVERQVRLGCARGYNSGFEPGRHPNTVPVDHAGRFCLEPDLGDRLLRDFGAAGAGAPEKKKAIPG